MPFRWWPWKKADKPAFEKILPSLVARIDVARKHQGVVIKSSRRVKLVIALYGSFAYLLATLILTLLVGYSNWGPSEIAVLAGGPVLIYLLRRLLSSYYDWMLSRSTIKVELLEKERKDIIADLMLNPDFVKIQDLIDRYGPTKLTNSHPGGHEPSNTNQNPYSSPHLNPPVDSTFAPSGLLAAELAASTPTPNASELINPPYQSPIQFPHREISSEIGSQYAPKWYDRLLDALAGVDETQAKNRVVLLCDNCRLVNGQAPPGKSIGDIGLWRCMGCGALNGVENTRPPPLKVDIAPKSVVLKQITRPLDESTQSPYQDGTEGKCATKLTTVNKVENEGDHSE